MAKGDKLTQKQIMIWTMEHNGIKTYYLIEKEPFENEGFKKSVHRVGSIGGDAVFGYLDQAEAELAKFPTGEEE